jgi:NitT/TauT family transport system ATP-binding protein
MGMVVEASTNSSTRSARDAVLEIRNVSVAFGGVTVVEDVSFALCESEFVCIVGASGSGKTTLLRAVAGLIAPSRGEVRFLGNPIVAPRNDIAVVFQDYGKALLPWRNAYGNVSLALEARNIPRGERSQIIMSFLERVGLAEHAEKLPLELSGGMQQRLQIARCLAMEPRVLLMDEPFGSLDAMTRQSLQDEVSRIAADTGISVLFVTHDLEEAIYLGDRVISLDRNPGRIQDLIEIGLPRPRNQLTTREAPEFLRHRHHLFHLLQH